MKKWIPILLCLMPILWILGAEALLIKKPSIVEGSVVDENGPVANARVREQGKNPFVLTDDLGRFTIPVEADSGFFVKLTAGKEGWYNGGASIVVGDTATLIISELPEGDSFFYQFKSANECFACHSTLLSQWQESKHATAATNPMLLQIYNGTDVDGNANVAPGFKLDFPDQGGDCADCHAPAAAILNPGNMDLNDIHLVGPVAQQGVFCDFCHKIKDVEVDYDTGINGSITLQRPPPGSQRDINIGPFDDVTTPWMGGTYREIYTKSAYCSGCHQYKNLNDVLVDDTYDSWAASSYAAENIHCQDCHMKPWADSIFVGGIGIADAVQRDPARIYNHRFTGATSTDFQEQAVDLLVESEIIDDTLLVRAMVTNAGAGHSIPNGVSFRNILLAVSADNGGIPLIKIAGDTIPHFGGIGNPEDGNYAGSPGTAFALVTRNSADGSWPVPNWLTTEIFYDSRIPPQQTDTSEYKFLLSGGDIMVSAKLLYRAVYKPWADAKGWDMRENTMQDTAFSLPLTGIEAPEVLPDQVSLAQNFPNPFNPTTTIQIELAKTSAVQLRVFDMAGKLVRVLHSGSLTSGRHAFQWDGKDQSGSDAASSMYLYQLQTGSFLEARKMLLLR